MARMIDLVASTTQNRISTLSFIEPSARKSPLLPVFITCDPARDTPSVLKSYLAEFHPGLVGLTGTWEQVKDVCKAYRVYFSTPEGAKPGMDYLVDHSIYFYLMGEWCGSSIRGGMANNSRSRGRFCRGYRATAQRGEGCENHRRSHV